MNKISEALLKRYLKPAVQSDLPGRLRLVFEKYGKLPREAQPYLHYVRDIFLMLPGVKDCTLNERIGTVLILYDAAVTNPRAILRWAEVVTDECIRMSEEIVWQGANEQDLEALIRKRLSRHLPNKEGIL